MVPAPHRHRATPGRRPLGTVKDGAELLGMRGDSFRKLDRDGVLPPGVVVRVGRRLRVDLDALERFIDDGGRALPGGWRRETPEAAT